MGASGRDRVVLLHGLWFGPSSLFLLARRLRGAGFETATFGYGTVRRGLAEHARALSAHLRSMPGEEPVHLVGHSLGGLVILRMLDEYRELPPGRVVCLGTPVHGSAAARRLAGNRLARAALGRNRDVLQRGWPHRPGGRDIGLVAGSRGLGMGRLLGSVEGPSDGTVAVEETRLAGADHLVLPVSHTSLVLSRRVARAVAAYLRHGRFRED